MKYGTSKGKIPFDKAHALKGKNFAIVDVETSGTSPFDRIIEIGILRIEDGVCVETFKTCINPEIEVSPWITRLTGIQQSEVDSAPSFVEVQPTIQRLLTNAIFVAHNVAFDYAFVRAEFLRAEKYFSSQCLCTVRLSRLLSPRAKHHNLSALIRRHKFVCTSRHRAFDDAHVLWQFLQWGSTAHSKRLKHSLDTLLMNNTTAHRIAARMVERSEGDLVIR